MPRQRFSEKTNTPQPLPDIQSPLALKLGKNEGSAPSTTPGFDQRSIDELFSATYEELRRLAAFAKRNYAGAPLSPTTLVNEAWLKLAHAHRLHFESALHFKLTAARAMRQILVEAARRQGAEKRGGDGEVMFVVFDDSAHPMRCDRQLLALHDSLNDLSRLNPRQAMLVESRYFGGMDVAETAALLEISETTALRDWRAAKAWLAAEIRRKH
jgi:RNA polymerase sigma factor (TIGR02999 family)